MSENDLINKSGKLLTRRVWNLIDHVEAVTNTTLVVIQGGFRDGDGASASSGTHDKGDVYDISVDNMSEAEALEVVWELRKWYGDAWLRSSKFGWTSTGAHIHCVQADSYYALSREAMQQVAAYNNGRNGLANNGPDPHPRPTTRYHFSSIIQNPQVPPTLPFMEDHMFVARVQYGTNNVSFWLVGGVKGMVNLGSDEAATWTGARMTVNDAATWSRILAKFGPQ